MDWPYLENRLAGEKMWNSDPTGKRDSNYILTEYTKKHYEIIKFDKDIPPDLHHHNTNSANSNREPLGSNAGRASSASVRSDGRRAAGRVSSASTSSARSNTRDLRAAV
jgi:hypothetical protein